MSMELNHSFTVPVPPDQAWNVLLDVEKIAPCMPGAQVDTVDGDDVAGRLKVKVGPVSLTYKGTATFKDRDTADRSVLVEASGKEMRGAGTASATVRAALSPEDGSGSGTLVTLHTTLNVTGKPAQFGRGVIAEVGSRLIDKFADNLAQQLTNGGVAVAPAAATPAAGTPAADAAPGSPGTTPAAGGEAPSNGGPSAAPSAAAPAAPAPSAAASSNGGLSAASASAAPAAAAPPAAAPSAAAPSAAASSNGGLSAAPASAAPASAAPASAAPATAAPSTAAPSTAAPASAAPATAPAAAPAAHVPVPSAPELVQPVPVQHQEDSLNLLSLVGPVIVRRLAPVVGAATAVGVLTWGVRRVLRHRKTS